MTDAALLRQVGQEALPLLCLYLESRHLVQLPRQVDVGAGPCPLFCVELVEGSHVRVIGVEQPEKPVIKTEPDNELTLESWPGRVVNQSRETALSDDGVWPCN